jgi:hypothetical protein
MNSHLEENNIKIDFLFQNQYFSLKTNMCTIIYKVSYHVVGTDHCGYCSGAEADNNDIVDFYTTKKRPMKTRISDIKELNYVKRGCTSGGSGYCCGFGQTYIAKSIIYEKKISKKKESESGSDSESKSGSDSESKSGSDSESKSGSDSESKSGSDSE